MSETVLSEGEKRERLHELMAEFSTAMLVTRTSDGGMRARPLSIAEKRDDGGLYFGSDQIEFAKAGIPAVFPFSGSAYVGKPKDYGEERWNAYSAKDYHQVTDEVRADWDLSGAVEDARWLLIAGFNVAESSARPQWTRASEFRRK